jgi:hypothetical protein
MSRSKKGIRVSMAWCFAATLWLCLLAPAAIPSEAAVADKAVVPLKVIDIPTPQLDVTGYDTSGVVPQVSAPGLSLSAVNTAVLQSVRANQTSYAPSAQQAIRNNRAGGGDEPGIYQTRADPRFISASSVVVSAMISTEELYPGGNDGSLWVSVTAEVPSGTTVDIQDLFETPTQGMAALGVAIGTKLWKTDDCWHIENLTSQRWIADNFGEHGPARNVQTYALTVRGIAVGFPQGELGTEGCGAPVVTIPYHTIRPFLSRLGERLVAGVRQPRY